MLEFEPSASFDVSDWLTTLGSSRFMLMDDDGLAGADSFCISPF